MSEIKKRYTNLKRIGLKQRILIVYIAVAIFPLLLIHIYYHEHTKDLLIQYTRDIEITNLIQLKDTALANTQIQSEKADFIKKQLELMIHNRSIQTLLVLNNKVIYSNQPGIAVDVDCIISKIEKDKPSSTILLEGRKCILSLVPIDLSNTEEEAILISIYPYQDILSDRNKQSFLEGLFLFLCLTASIIIFYSVSDYFIKRLNEFKIQIHKAAAGDFIITEKIVGHDEISELYEDLNTMISNIKHLATTVSEEQVQKEKLNTRQKEVEFKMLASQINPHFIYNTLEAIRMKARFSKETEIEELVKMLAKIMRRNIQAGDTLVTLQSEIDLVEYYLKIQQFRFGDRIKYSIILKNNIDHLKIMPLIIQPVVENAFVHGLETKLGKGEMRIVIELTDRLMISVIDDGVGMSKLKLEEIIESLNDVRVLDRSHIGLSNVNQRIKLLYGDEYGLHIESEENKGTTVKIELPADMRQ